MTDLTEQWNLGKLPEGDYYIKRRNGYLLYDNIDSSGVWRNSIDEDIVEVLAPVPSYDDYVSFKKFMVDGINAVNSIRELEERLKKTQELELELRKENATLKELLKRARNILEDEGDYMIVQKIDEVLK